MSIQNFLTQDEYVTTMNKDWKLFKQRSILPKPFAPTGTWLKNENMLLLDEVRPTIILRWSYAVQSRILISIVLNTYEYKKIMNCRFESFICEWALYYNQKLGTYTSQGTALTYLAIVKPIEENGSIIINTFIRLIKSFNIQVDFSLLNSDSSCLNCKDFLGFRLIW